MVLYVWVAVLAAVLGSFANVLIHRLPLMVMRELGEAAVDNESAGVDAVFNIASPASHCPACYSPLRWWHNVPLLSFVLLRGRCGFCRERIPSRYVWVELGTVALGLYCASKFGFNVLALSWFAFLYVLWVAAWIDAAHFLLPDALTLSLLWMGLILKVFFNPAALPDAILGAAMAYGMLRIIYEVYFALTGKHGMGMGDMKLLAAIGAWLGLVNVPQVVLVSCAVALLFALYARWRFRAVMIPFGPFLAVGAAVVVATGYEGRLF